MSFQMYKHMFGALLNHESGLYKQNDLFRMTEEEMTAAYAQLILRPMWERIQNTDNHQNKAL